MNIERIDDLMQERIEKFNIFILGQDFDNMHVGLFSGKMGICIYLYHQAKIEGNKKYKKLADKLLNSICSQMHNQMPIELEYGLTGLGWGILYLIENDFVQGNANCILKEIDDKIFSTYYYDFLIKRQNRSLDDLIKIVHYTYYFCERISNKKLSRNERDLFQQIVIKSINKIETAVEIDKMTEPFPFSPYSYFPFIYLQLIYKVYELGFYTYKTEKVCDEWSDNLLTAYPLLNSYRLLLSHAMEQVNSYRNLSLWNKHIEVLKQQTDISYTISNEFRNKSILLQNGIAAFYFLLKRSGRLSDSFKEGIINKIALSNIWEDFFNAENEAKLQYMGLMNGLCGVILAYQDMIKITGYNNCNKSEKLNIV